MTLSQAQKIFTLNIAKLIIWAYDQGYELTFGEAVRTMEQQKIYLASGASKTLNSGHLKRLAVDLNLFIDGVYMTDTESYKPLAEYWKILHPKNIAGYDWKFDGNHFEMQY